MSNPKTAANGMLPAVAASSLAGLALLSPTDACFRAASTRHPITIHKSQIINSLHLLQSPKLDASSPTSPEKGTNEVGRVVVKVGGASSSPDPAREQDAPATFEPTTRVHINATQSSPSYNQKSAIENHQLLGYADLQHYQKIVVALRETIRLMVAIDQAIASYGGWPGAFGGGGYARRSIQSSTMKVSMASGRQIYYLNRKETKTGRVI